MRNILRSKNEADLKYTLDKLYRCRDLEITNLWQRSVWILMSKASKAWYEVYENAIWQFENKHYKKLNLPYENIMGNMEFPIENKNNSIFSTKGGAYSPSKINILIGQISFSIIVVLEILHFILSIIFSNAYFVIGNLVLIIITCGSLFFIIKSKKIVRSFL